MSKRKVERIPHEATEQADSGNHRQRLADIVERHESFGLASVSRISHGPGQNNMFGSHLDTHPTTFRFTVRRAVRLHSTLAYDRYHCDHHAERPDLIEFEMTATQFVDLMTNMNYGEGIPCTLRHVLGEQVEDVPPEHMTERQLIRERFQAEMRDIAASVKPLTDSIDATLAKRTLGKGDRESIAADVAHIVRVLSDHAPWVMRQFTESTNRLESAGKAEVEAYAESVIRAAGLEALRRMSGSGQLQVTELEAAGVAALPPVADSSE